MSLMFWALAAWAGGEDLLREGRVQEAFPAVKAEAEAHPDDVAAMERWLDLLSSLGMPDLAVAEAQRAVVAHPGSADANYLLGRALPTADLSRRAYERALELDPKHARATMGLGSLARVANDAVTAEARFSAAVALNPSLVEAWQGLVTARLLAGRPDAAIEAARQTIRANPAKAEGYLTLAVLDPPNAVATLAQGSSKVKDDPRVFASLAAARLEAADVAGARKAVDAALAIDPGRPEAVDVDWVLDAVQAGALSAADWKKIGDIRKRQRTNVQAARVAADALAAAAPKSTVPLVIRARVLESAGEPVAAGLDLQAALKLDPSDVEAESEVGRWLLANGRAAEAKRWLEAASVARAWDPGLALAAGNAALASGDAAWAAAFLASAERRFPYDAQIVVALANAQSKAGNREAAYQTLSAATRRLPDGRLVVALAAAAKDTGRYAEAADIVDALATRLDRKSLHDLAAKLRASAPPK